MITNTTKRMSQDEAREQFRADVARAEAKIAAERLARPNPTPAPTIWAEATGPAPANLVAFVKAATARLAGERIVMPREGTGDPAYGYTIIIPPSGD